MMLLGDLLDDASPCWSVYGIEVMTTDALAARSVSTVYSPRTRTGPWPVS